MAHEVESMMYVGDTPWHGLGKNFSKDRRLSIEEAIDAAGLNWEVKLCKILVEHKDDCKSSLINNYATTRSSDNAFLGIVGRDYKPLQNKEAFKWFEPFISNSVATIETAGSLKGGKRVWILARINRDPISVNKIDEIAHYILLSNSHDGNITARVGFTPIRVVCNNTLTLSHKSKASQLLRVKHTSRIRQNLEQIRSTMDLAYQEFRATIEQYRLLANKGINHKDLDEYVRQVFDLKKPEDGAKRNQEKIVPKVIRLFEEGRGSQMAGRNYWGAYNAVTEYLNYFRGKNQDNILNSLWFGDSAKLNNKALNKALDKVA